MRSSTRRCSRAGLALLAACCLSLPVVAADVQESSAGPDGVVRVPKFTLIPEYPKIARRDRIEGEVRVCFEITRDGRTRRIAVRNSTNRVFEKPAMRAVRASTYEPLPPGATLAGIKTCRTFRFSLEPVVVETDS